MVVLVLVGHDGGGRSRRAPLALGTTLVTFVAFVSLISLARSVLGGKVVGNVGCRGRHGCFGLLPGFDLVNRAGSGPALLSFSLLKLAFGLGCFGLVAASVLRLLARGWAGLLP